MKYNSGSAFRQSLEERLRRQSMETGIPLLRLRKMAAFERFLARLLAAQPQTWILKGGLMLQVRAGLYARTTQDVDLLLRNAATREDIHAMLVEACRSAGEDWFTYEVARPGGESLRFPVRALLDGRPFETFHLDVGIGDPLVEPPETLLFPSLFAFSELPPLAFPAYPLSQQIAEKVHACTRPYQAGESSRVKDWVDILLLAQQGTLQSQTLRQALEATFQTRATHPLPQTFPPISTTWTKPFLLLAEQAHLAWTLEQANDALARFLDPILQKRAAGSWRPDLWEWK
jgi:hypothetical protein